MKGIYIMIALWSEMFSIYVITVLEQRVSDSSSKYVCKSLSGVNVF